VQTEDFACNTSRFSENKYECTINKELTLYVLSMASGQEEVDAAANSWQTYEMTSWPPS